MHKNKTILVTGAAGYIGSHTCVKLLMAGHKVIAIDNLSNSSREALTRVEFISGKKIVFYEQDIRNRNELDRVLGQHTIDAVIHFAGLKAVGESVEKPLRYYDNNVNGTVTLLSAMADANIRRFLFSSSATVYGDPKKVPIPETAPLSATNPYGRSKLIIEEMIGDLVKSDPSWAIAVLRYFNPVGAHPTGLIGEDPRDIPNNLMPYVAQVAVGRREKLAVFGNDYPTIDGTGVRDYIHVMDLAKGHVDALAHLFNLGTGFTLNLGTGKGYSVLQVIEAFEKASGKPIPYEIVGRRPGDVASCYANPSLAYKTLGWESRRSLEDMCADHWRWQSKNPKGYEPV